MRLSFERAGGRSAAGDMRVGWRVCQEYHLLSKTSHCTRTRPATEVSWCAQKFWTDPSELTTTMTGSHRQRQTIQNA